jgi:hypothetical protein
LLQEQVLLGFFSSWVKNAVQTGKTIVNFEYDNDPEVALVVKMHDCNEKIENGFASGYPA